MSMLNNLPGSTHGMESQIERLRTFSGWPKHVAQVTVVFPAASLLAKYGFYYTGTSTKVTCCGCNLVFNVERRKRAFRSVLDEHSKLSPGCEMQRGALNRPIVVTDTAVRTYEEWRQRRRDRPTELYPSLFYNIHPNQVT